jgi:hypothetical protein
MDRSLPYVNVILYNSVFVFREEFSFSFFGEVRNEPFPERKYMTACILDLISSELFP